MLKIILAIANRLRNPLQAFITAGGLEAAISNDGDDSLIDGETRQERDQRLATEHLKSQQREEKDRREKEADTDFFVAVLMEQERQRVLNKILADVADARKAVSVAYSRALEAASKASEALGHAKAYAIVLADGRHVYFTRDNINLYSEDDLHITDRPTIESARRLQTPDSTTYESLLAWRLVHEEAMRDVQQLEETLGKIDCIEERIRTGTPSAEQIAQARLDIDDIIQSLPPESRAEYDHMQAVRRGGENSAYRTVDASFSSVPGITAEFFRAGQPQAPSQSTPEPTQATDRSPAYRSAPEF